MAHDLVFYAVCRIRDAPVSKSSNYMTAVYSMFGVVVRKIGYQRLHLVKYTEKKLKHYRRDLEISTPFTRLGEIRRCIC